MGLIKNRVRLYIDVCGRDTDDPYDLSNKMNDLLQRKIATYKIQLKLKRKHNMYKTIYEMNMKIKMGDNKNENDQLKNGN